MCVSHSIPPPRAAACLAVADDPRKPSHPSEMTRKNTKHLMKFDLKKISGYAIGCKMCGLQVMSEIFIYPS